MQSQWTIQSNTGINDMEENIKKPAKAATINIHNVHMKYSLEKSKHCNVIGAHIFMTCEDSCRPLPLLSPKKLTEPFETFVDRQSLLFPNSISGKMQTMSSHRKGI